MSIHDRDEYSHLKAFGCTAYALDKAISKGDKISLRAKKGYLVGYNSRNIYRILLLEEETVIGTRDVTFNESLFLGDQQESTSENEIVPLIDFSMIPSNYSIVYDLENPSIRNNEPNSR